MALEEIRANTRIGPFSVFDITTSYLAVILIWLFLIFTLTKNSSYNGLLLLELILAVIPLSVLVHTITGTETKLTKMVFDPSFKNKSGNISKLITGGSIVAMIVVGMFA